MRGTERVVKTIEGRFSKKLPLAKDFANERNESLLSNCRVQLILSKGRRRDSKDSFFNGKEPYIQGNTSEKRKLQLYHSSTINLY